MVFSKDELKKDFSKNWEKHYKIDFLLEKGFIRKKCKKCGKYFWTLDPDRELCGDPECVGYQFIGEKVTKEKLSYVESWKKIEKFFIENGHESIKRYPVVCRWYPLPFVIASIVDFYRIENGRITFEMPANPLVVPQFSIRFKDVENVGVTGRHYTSFVMIGQHTIYDGKNGYWKEKTIELDYKLLTEVFGIKPEEITFIEDLWMGPQAFGPSMEYFVRGLELGNAVFTQFEIVGNSVREMKNKVVDMGAGLERFAWISSMEPTSYDVTFEPALKYLRQFITKIPERDFLVRYYKVAGKYDAQELGIEKLRKLVANELGYDKNELSKIFEQLEGIYSIADHIRTLALAISDGALPSNVGGGYNLRVIFRRAIDFIEKFSWDIDLMKLVEIYANQLSVFGNEINENLNLIQKIFDIEKKKYKETKKRAKRIIESIVRKKEKIDENDLLLLYQSHGITPEVVKSFVPDIKIPQDFYEKISNKTRKVKEVKTNFTYDLSGIPPTKMLFYERENEYEFDATVLKVFDNRFVILDETLFYPKMGGQDHDTGYINGSKVIRVFKIGKIIVHEVENPSFKEGERVHGIVDKERRKILTLHHDATHILMAACREVLGKHVWQAGAEKTVDKARLDITHYQNLTEEEIEKIENVANRIIKEAKQIRKFFLPRGEAERRYGFKIYQGGYVPDKVIRIVEIDGYDVEACSGTHGSNTKEVCCITILKTKKIHDGVVRIEFAANVKAVEYLRKKSEILDEVEKLLRASDENVVEKTKELFEEWKRKRKK